MVPCNVIGSSIPGAIFRYRLHNRSDGPLTASIAFSLPNYIGADCSSHEANCYATQHTYGPKENVNEFRQDDGFCGCERLGWTKGSRRGTACGCDEGVCAPSGHPGGVGNHYCTIYEDAWDVARREMVRLPGLEAKTVTFIKDFLSSDIPAVIREAALFNLSTLRTQTCFRTVDGYFFGFEGSHEYQGCCLGS